MDLKELLKAQGLNEETVNKITSAMKENKVYATSEENADIRILKLKEERDQAHNDLKEANKTLKELKKSNADIESLQSTISKYEGEMKELEKARTKDKKEFDVKNKLKDAGCKDIDYILYKLGDIEKLDVEKELDSKIKKLRENHTDFFNNQQDLVKQQQRQDPKVIVNKLPGLEGQVKTFSKENVSRMSPKEINANWDLIKDLDLSK
ncbi:phage scaffolding protein [Clostridium sp. YIM B02505]|uniref:Phage scaffolding protein n=1 Tax=Clostridium yunnanense TaxID=2800325 RepID=A0ABS1EJ97_9CLOT|nr:phage scaffolding protein [Clostridium yunnanense]MBK1809438.1 phage scaffolding protein [Clostridium yunnanense]